MCPGIHGCGCVRHSMRRSFFFFFLSGVGRGGRLLVSTKLITYVAFVSTCVWFRRQYILSAGSCFVCLSSQRKCFTVSGASYVSWFTSCDLHDRHLSKGRVHLSFSGSFFLVPPSDLFLLERGGRRAVSLRDSSFPHGNRGPSGLALSGASGGLRGSFHCLCQAFWPRAA